MLKIQSNLKINGRHWGLAFVDGVAYTANVALAAKLLLKGYAVTGQPDQPVARPIDTKQELSSTSSSPEQDNTSETVTQLEDPVSTTNNSVSTSDSVVSNAIAEAPKPKFPRPRKKAVKADAADER